MTLTDHIQHAITQARKWDHIAAELEVLEDMLKKAGIQMEDVFLDEKCYTMTAEQMFEAITNG
jgi:hypothetical protein